MSDWLNHVTIAAPENGTTTHTVSPSSGTVSSGAWFTPTAGRLLVCIAAGDVTSSTPSGWTLPSGGAAENNGAIEVWHRTAAGSDSFTTTHNASDYPASFDFYEFPAGSTFNVSAASIGVASGATGPTISSLTGTNWLAGAGQNGSIAGTTNITHSWAAGTEIVDSFVARGNNNGYGYSLTEFNSDVSTSKSVAASFTYTGSTSIDCERLMFAVAIGGAAPPPPVSLVNAATTIPSLAGSFTATMPTHAAGDRLVLYVGGKYDTAGTPTINQGWTLVGSGTGGTGAAAADTGTTFWRVFAKDATSAAETAPVVTAAGTAVNSWEAICHSYRPGTGMVWADTIGASAGWVKAGTDATTASPLTATAADLTGFQPTTSDAVAAFGTIPTDLGTALGTTTVTATGLTGGTVTTTTGYVENALGTDSASVGATWTGFTGTASAGVAMSFTVTGATNQSGSLVAVALRQMAAPYPFELLTPTPRYY